MFGSLDLGIPRKAKERVTGTSDGWPPACHLCGKLHRTCIADIGWCLTFVSAPPIGYDPRAEDLRKHVLPAHHRHTGTCNRPDNITPLASLVRVDSGKSAVALIRGARYSLYVVAAEICQGPGTIMLSHQDSSN